MEFQQAGHVWAYVGGAKRVSETMCYVGGARQEFQKPLLMWVESDIELQQAAHIWAYVGRQMESIENYTPCGRGKTGSSGKYAIYRCMWG